MSGIFQRATRQQAKLRLALSGPSGSGKTTGALMIAQGLGGRVAVVDTERGSASLYADQFVFDTVELGPPYSPERYIEMIHAAEDAGYDVIILDSITHEWNGAGGVLSIVDQIGKTKYRGNSYAAWSDGTPRHQAFVDAMLSSKCHIIATMRSKTAYLEGERNGKKTITKAGTEPQQRDGLEYEFTAVLDISVDGNTALASKDRTRLFHGNPFVITPDTGRMLLNWLNEGEARPTPPPAAPSQPQAQHQPTPQGSAQAASAQRQSSAMTRGQLDEIYGWLKSNFPDQTAMLAELTQFFQKEIKSLRDLTWLMADEYLQKIHGLQRNSAPQNIQNTAQEAM